MGDSILPFSWASVHFISYFGIVELPLKSQSCPTTHKFPETATALVVRLDSYSNLILSAPHGIEDAINLVVKPTPYFTADYRRLEVYRSRMEQKKWKRYWPKLTIKNSLYTT